MILKSLELTNFRNIKFLRHEFSPGLNLFLGKNGQGKTNLIEAIYFLIHGHSFRFSNSETLISFNQEFAVLKASLNIKDISNEVKIIIRPTKKEVLVNQKIGSINQIKKKLKLVLFSPESLSFIKDSADQRRELIDEFLIFIDDRNVDLLTDFKRALKNKNKLLRDFKDEKIPKNQFEEYYNSLNEIYLKSAVALTQRRIYAIREILPDLNDSMRNITHSDVDMSVDYVASEQSLINLSDQEIAEIIIKRQKELMLAEWSSGITLVGPHKHEINFLYNQKDSRIFCSQGQQRAIILSFKMGQIVYHKRKHGSYPILLLDDVLSELDIEKRGKLTEFLGLLNTQIFLTSTEIDSVEKINIQSTQINYLENGTIIKTISNKGI